MSGNGKDDFNRLRAQFSRRANAPEIPALASKLCWWIAYGRMDLKRRSTFVSQITLANDLGGVTVRSVQRMIDVLKPLGLNVAPGHGPNRASTYWIGEANTTSMSPIEADNTTSMSPIQPGQGDTGVGSTRHSCHLNTTPVSPLLKKVSKKDTNKSAPPARSSADADRESAPTNSATVEHETPMQRADALHETVEAQDQQPRRNNPIGTAAANDANGSDPGTEALRRVQFLNVTVVYPPDRIGDEEVAFQTFCATKGERPLMDIVEDVKSVVRDDNGNVPLLSDTLLTLARGQARRTGRQ